MHRREASPTADHFHPCASCGFACECINDMASGDACLGCGRKECPGNANDPLVQGREE
jgi:hypothetical protein